LILLFLALLINYDYWKCLRNIGTEGGTQRHVWRFKTSDLDAMLSVPAVLSIDGRIK
jgi:hypothetical protein